MSTPTPTSPGLILSPDELSSYQSQYGQEKISPITPTEFQRRVLLRREKELGLFGGKWSGKRGQLTSNLLTPNGNILMGDVKVGDALTNPDGTISRVIQVHPQVHCPIYRFSLSDGRQASSALEHLWLCKTKYHKPHICETQQIMELHEKTPVQLPSYDTHKNRVVYHEVVDIECIGNHDAQCISVDNPNGLYITDDNVVTHNSFCARLFLIKGNSHLPNYDSSGNPIYVNQSYIYHNGYRATILRRNQIDLDDFVRKFKLLVAPYGGEWKNGMFTFPFSQAVIAVGHLADKDAWQKYIGVPNIRFVIEEAALIPEYGLYEQMITNCRSDYPELEPQIMLTSNFGGPGTSWILERFIEAKDSDGVFIPAGTPIYDTAPHPIHPEEIVTTSRIWMFSTFTDNPYSASDPSYIASMATLKDEKLRRAYIYGDWSVFQGQYFCCDSETEILTETGFKPMLDVVPGEVVASLTPLGELVYLPCSAVHKYQYKGGLLCCKNKNTDIMVTPNHRMYCEKDNGKGVHYGFDFVPAINLPRKSLHKMAPDVYLGKSLEYIEIVGTDYSSAAFIEVSCPICSSIFTTSARAPKKTCSTKCSYELRQINYGNKTPKLRQGKSKDNPSQFKEIRLKFAAGDFLEFLGWYLSEGSLERGIGSWKNGYSIVNIAQEKHQDRVDRIANLLDRLGLHFYYDGVRFTIYSVALARWFEKFGKSHDKYIPREFLGLSHDLLRRLYDGLTLGDGFVGESGHCTYYTTSITLADNVQELCQKLGMVASISKKRQSIGREFGYWIGIWRPGARTTSIFNRDLKSMAYDGMVGCVTVPPHNTILIRRNGKLLWTGNSSFRPHGPNLAEGEPPYANHVLHPPFPKLQPWWPRWGSIDVGYAHDTAVYQACILPNGQHHIYNEFVVSQASYIQIGYELASRSLDALNGPSHSITYWISHDAVRQDKDRKSIMELISIGIAKRIGPDAVHIPDLVIHQLKEAAQYDNRELAEETLKAIRSERKAGITLRIAPSHRVIGWQYCREALRWSTIGETIPPYDPELANLLLLNFPDKYEEYQGLYRYQKPEVLPKLQIWDCCPILISAIPKARHYPLDSPGKDPEDVCKDHYKGMDSLDSWRYLEMGLVETFPDEPWESYLDRSLQSALDHDPSMALRDKVMFNRVLESEFLSKQLPATISIPRKALRRQRASFLAKLTRPFSPHGPNG